MVSRRRAHELKRKMRAFRGGFDGVRKIAVRAVRAATVLRERTMDIRLLIDAQQEILALRRRNELLEAKVSTMELFGLALKTLPASQSRVETVDIAWKLARAIEEAAKAEAAPKAAD